MITTTTKLTNEASALHAAAERLLLALYPHRHQLADAQSAITRLAMASMLFEAAA